MPIASAKSGALREDLQEIRGVKLGSAITLPNLEAPSVSIEPSFAPIDDNVTISLDVLIRRLTDSGLACKIEPESENMHWVVFKGYESALLASVNDGQFVFGTLHTAIRDSPSLVERVDAVMRSCGYSAGEEQEFE
jgi:hypothetical protein